ncbi:protein of unknown function [Legionella hackeliae]|uniref:Uncharacterized protein n=1 Tax=Legionella hackeliae TaxID=449 RepID=A0A0A8UNC7_LEGHA|nr:protein of unknown function [Legionella hackeliae]
MIMSKPKMLRPRFRKEAFLLVKAITTTKSRKDIQPALREKSYPDVNSLSINARQAVKIDRLFYSLKVCL